MLYTLAKFFVWGLGFAVIGGIIGWLLRSVRCSQELAAARRTTVDTDEVDRLRHRVANLEPLIADRDTLRARLADTQDELNAARKAATVETAAAGVQGLANLGPSDAVAVDAAPVAPAFAAFVVPHDADAAKAALGSAVAADDLKVVEGIGPVLEQVLHAGGITTWAHLASTDPGAIRGILTSADDRHRMHDPTSWPRQARLAALGEWDALKGLQDRLTAGRS